jgi:hypothetical protein
MTSPNIPRVIEFLSAYPNGAYGWQIAGNLDVTDDSIGQTLLLMQGRSQVALIQKGISRAESLWRIASYEEGGTPPVFRAMETLKAFRTAAREKLSAANKGEAVCA